MSTKFVLYRRDIRAEQNNGYAHSMYLIKDQLRFGEILSRVNESRDEYTREVLAESDDLDVLYQLKALAEGENDEI